MLTYFLFALGFVFLIKGADLLVEGSSAIAKKFDISDMIVGLTIVSFGTSMPELVVNVVSSFNGSSEIAIGNVIGSNISNILLILGVSAIIFPLPIRKNTILSEIPFSLAGVILVGYLANAELFNMTQHHARVDQDLTISRSDGILLLFFFALFIGYIFQISRENKESIILEEPVKAMSMNKSVIYVILGMLGLYYGGDWVVTGAIEMARHLGMSETFIGLTVISIGTSLPELVTSAIAASKRNTDIAVGNIIGSNIFNVFWILGVSASIRPLDFQLHTNTDILVLIFATSVLIFAVATGKHNSIERWHGILFLILYALYMAFLIYRG